MISIKGDRQVVMYVRVLRIVGDEVEVEYRITADGVTKKIGRYALKPSDDLKLTYTMNINGEWTA